MPDTIVTSESIELAYAVNGIRPRLQVHDRQETISNFLRIHGVWQRPITMFLLNYLKSGDVFVDVGANIGYFSVYAGLLVGPSGRVHAIEPDSDNAALLASNAALNDLSNIQLHRTAASNYEGQAILFRGGFNAGAHSLLEKPNLAPGPMVPVITLDGLLHGERAPALVKIDVQGADQDVLQGMSNLLYDRPTMPAIIVEFCPVELAGRGQLDAFFGFVDSHDLCIRAFIANERAATMPPKIRRPTLQAIATDLVQTNDAAEFDLLLEPRRRALQSPPRD